MLGNTCIQRDDTYTMVTGRLRSAAFDVGCDGAIDARVRGRGLWRFCLAVIALCAACGSADVVVPTTTDPSPPTADTRASSVNSLIGAAERLNVEATIDPIARGSLLDTEAFTADWLCVDEQGTDAELIELTFLPRFAHPTVSRTSVSGERHDNEWHAMRVEQPGVLEVVVFDSNTGSISAFCADLGVVGFVGAVTANASQDGLSMMRFDPDELGVSASSDFTTFCEAGRATADQVSVALQVAGDSCVTFDVEGEEAWLSREYCSRTDPVSGDNEATVRSPVAVRQLRDVGDSVLMTYTTERAYRARIVAPVGPNLLQLTQIRWDAAPQLGAPTVIERMIDVPDETLTVSEIVELLDRARAESRRGVVEVRSDCADTANAVAEQLVVEYDAR